jgi:hypothetical protein
MAGADCRVRASPDAQFVAQVGLENVFLSQSEHRLTSSSRAAQFDKLTRRGKAGDTSWIARDRVYQISETRGALTQRIFRAGRARTIVEATLGKPIGEASSCAITRRKWADHDNTKPSSTRRLWRANLASSSVSRIRCRSHRARARRRGDLPKNCHLLPSTAILEPQNRYAPFNRSIRCPSRAFWPTCQTAYSSP